MLCNIDEMLGKIVKCLPAVARLVDLRENRGEQRNGWVSPTLAFLLAGRQTTMIGGSLLSVCIWEEIVPITIEVKYSLWLIDVMGCVIQKKKGGCDG